MKTNTYTLYAEGETKKVLLARIEDFISELENGNQYFCKLEIHINYKTLSDLIEEIRSENGSK